MVTIEKNRVFGYRTTWYFGSVELVFYQAMQKEELWELFNQHKEVLMDRAIFELKLTPWRYALRWDAAEFTLFARQWLEYHLHDGYYPLVELLEHYARLHTPRLLLRSKVAYIEAIQRAANFLITRLKECLIVQD